MSGELARARLKRRRDRGSIDPESVNFFDAVTSISPHLTRPYWLSPLVDALRRSFLASAGIGAPVFTCCSVPPQHAKTKTIQHAIAWWLKHRPQDPILYATYNEDLVRQKSREIRDYAQIAGVQLRPDERSLNTWTTSDGGGLMARALVGGPITGQPGLRLIVIDDPFKGRREAESAAYRRDVWQSFTDNIISRLHPRTSVLVNHTRWHEDDLIGRIMAEQGDDWTCINLPALNETGEALWPEGQPRWLLDKKREKGGEYGWWSLYMGQPRPREGKMFQDVRYFDDAPTHARIAIGVDLAYSGKTSSDWCVAVVMAESAGRYYVLDVVRRQVPASTFATDIIQLQRSYPFAPTLMYASGKDWEQVEVMRKLGVSIAARPASSDKFIRAQPLSAAWNDRLNNDGEIERPGVVALQRGAHWLGAYTSVMLGFTGHGDDHDDDVDATAAAFDALPSAPASAGPAVVVPQAAVEARPRRDPGLTVRGRGKLGTW